MKKMILSLAIAAVTLCSCGVNVIDAETNKENNTSYIKVNGDYYDNGVIIDSSLPMYLDFDTMEKAPLCAAPNCTHMTSACLAKNAGNMPVFYNDHIYFFETNGGDVKETRDGKEFFIKSKLKKASLDSSEVQTVCEFDDTIPNIGYNAYVLHNNELYFVGDNPQPELNAYGGFSWGTTGGCHDLCCIDLDTGKYTNFGSIYDGDKQYEGAKVSSSCFISGVYKDKMYLQYSFTKKIMSPDDKKIEWTRVVFEFDFDTKTWTESELPPSRFMTNDEYTYFDEDSQELNIITDNGLKTASVKDYNILGEATIMSIYNGKLFMPTVGIWFDMADMSAHSMGDYKDYWVVTYYNGNYVLVDRTNVVKLTEEELRALGD